MRPIQSMLATSISVSSRPPSDNGSNGTPPLVWSSPTQEAHPNRCRCQASARGHQAYRSPSGLPAAEPWPPWRWSFSGMAILSCSSCVLRKAIGGRHAAHSRSWMPYHRCDGGGCSPPMPCYTGHEHQRGFFGNPRYAGRENNFARLIPSDFRPMAKNAKKIYQLPRATRGRPAPPRYAGPRSVNCRRLSAVLWKQAAS